jgi:iron-sulfur cluster assembly protein
VFDAMETTTTTATPEYRVGSEKLIKATEAAGRQVGRLLEKHHKPSGALRISIVGGGCSGLSYKMDLADGPRKGDILVDTAGAKILVDQKSALYVTGSSLDYVDAMIGGGFRMKNPNATATCSCGESFSV